MSDKPVPSTGRAVSPREAAGTIRDDNLRIGADRVGAESAAIGAIAGGVVLGAFFPREAHAERSGAAAVASEEMPSAADTVSARPAPHTFEGSEQERLAADATAHSQATIYPPGGPVEPHNSASSQDTSSVSEAFSARAAISSGDASGRADAKPVGLTEGSHSEGEQGASGGSSSSLHPAAVGTIEHGAGIADVGRQISEALHSDLATATGRFGDLLDQTHALAAHVTALPSLAADNLPAALADLGQTFTDAASAPGALVNSVEAPLETTLASLPSLPSSVGAAPPIDDLQAGVGAIEVSIGTVGAVVSPILDVPGAVLPSVSSISHSPSDGTDNGLTGSISNMTEHASPSSASVDAGSTAGPLPFDLPSLNLGFLGQSYSDLPHDEVGVLHDQGLLHGLV